MPDFEIRRAGPSDAEAMIGLILGLAEFEKLAPPDSAAQERLKADAFGTRPRFEAWLLWPAGAPEPAGICILFETYSTFVAKPSLYIEDLFVKPALRGRGYGSALLAHVRELAKERGCGRVEWTCLDWNTRAQAVYEELGAKRMSEWLLYRLTEF